LAAASGENGNVPTPATHATGKKTSGLRYWMLQVLEEWHNVAADFSPDSVHDLRVALRRCRSLADGLMALDPAGDWKDMKKAGKRLFQRLGNLRDTHVMEEWVEKLSAKRKPDQNGQKQISFSSENRAATDIGSDGNASQKDSADAVEESLLKLLAAREHEQKREAKTALEEFDQKQWREWSNILPARAARFRPGSALFKHLALERWTEARSLHARALRNRSHVAFHNLRIGIKRFRYIVENFLPEEHKAWSNDLKEMQDELGEVHDLDVLWETAMSCHVFSDANSRQQWHKKIIEERTKRIDRYRAKMVGEKSLWQVWRAALPQGKQIQALATRRMKLWAHSLDPDFAHSERVASMALQLYDGLLGTGWQPAVDGASGRTSLLAAALLHDVGKSKGEKGHHKASFKMIQAQGEPLGWKAAELRRAAVVARFHRGALPSKRHKLLRDLLPTEQNGIIQLAAILRLANALDSAHDGQVRRIQVENGRQNGKENRSRRTNGFLRKLPTFDRNEALTIFAEGYSPLGASARTIAAERHLLETVLGRPVMVKPMRGR